MDKIRVIERTAYTSKLVDDVKILTVPDIHYRKDKYLGRLKKLLEILKDIKPDAICIPGDFVDTFDDVYDNKEEVSDILYRFGKVAPTYLSFGSHDYYTFRDLDIKTELEKWFKLLKTIDDNLHVFEHGNTSDQVLHLPLRENFTISGFSIPIGADPQIENKRGLLLPYFVQFIKELELSSKDYNAILCHSPMSFFNDNKLIKISDYGMENIDLVLAGHQHASLLPPSLEFLDIGLTADKKEIIKGVVGLHSNEEDFSVMIGRGFLKFPGTLNGEFGPFGKLIYKLGNSVLCRTADCDLLTIKGKDEPKRPKVYTIY